MTENGALGPTQGFHTIEVSVKRELPVFYIVLVETQLCSIGNPVFYSPIENDRASVALLAVVFFIFFWLKSS